MVNFVGVHKNWFSSKIWERVIQWSQKMQYRYQIVQFLGLLLSHLTLLLLSIGIWWTWGREKKVKIRQSAICIQRILCFQGFWILDNKSTGKCMGKSSKIISCFLLPQISFLKINVSSELRNIKFLYQQTHACNSKRVNSTYCEWTNGSFLSFLELIILSEMN